MLAAMAAASGLQFLLTSRSSKSAAGAFVGSSGSSISAFSSELIRPCCGLNCESFKRRRGRNSVVGILHSSNVVDRSKRGNHLRVGIEFPELYLFMNVSRASRRLGCLLHEDVGITDVNNGSHGKEMEISKEAQWTAKDSEVLYRVPGWGSPYFFVGPQGHVCVRLSSMSDGSVELDLVELIEAVRKQDVQLPLVIKFPEIVKHRIKQLQDSFNSAILSFGYKSHFQGVFPVKCSHDRHVIEEIVKFGIQYQFGLEVGSKPELLIAMAKLRRSRRALLICNGYKADGKPQCYNISSYYDLSAHEALGLMDKVYMESVLLASQLGIKAVLVLEQMEELDLMIRCSRALGVRPLVGVRAKLSTKHNGHWGHTSGDNGKFGLTANEIIRVVYTLRHEKMLDCLQLLHFHIGSQIPSISIVKEAMREGSHLYCELALLGAPMGYIDVGGGLGIDYDGTKRQSRASTNYTMQNYANDVVAALVDACVLKGVSQPIIISESGRALVSHYSVLVFEVLSGTRPSERTALDDMEDLLKYSTSKLGVPTDCHSDVSTSGPQKGEYLLSTFYEVYQSVNEGNYWEAFNDAKQFKLEADSLFKLGCLSLEQRAQANALYEAVCHRVLLHAKAIDIPEELQSLRKSTAAVYHVNMSLFRSAPDMWAISQVFPVIPLQRLNEKPTAEATLADLTCDSDGKVDRFVGATGDISATLPVHVLQDGEQYYIGLFLAGAYQEVLGSAHNLFGATNVVHVRSTAAYSNDPTHAKAQNGTSGNNGRRYTTEHFIRGQTMAEVLSRMQHDADDMIEELQWEAEEAVADGRLSPEDAQILLRNYKCSLDSYTYLTR